METSMVDDSSCFNDDVPAMVRDINDGPIDDDYSHSIHTLERVCSLLQAYRAQSTPTTPWLTEAITTLQFYLGATFCEAFKHIGRLETP